MVVLLRGRGEAFCSGADLNWMQNAINLDRQDNISETRLLSSMYYELYSCKKVTIAVIHGSVYGGGIGLAAACDMAYSTEDTKFCFSELRVGLVASVISPYIVRKLGESRAKELIFTGRVFDGYQAEKYGLVNRSLPSESLEQLVGEYVSMILKGAPKAREISKELIHDVVSGKVGVTNTKHTAKILADVRISREAVERIESFLSERVKKFNNERF
jgi:methylglutaconyl-CoA hydratase